MIQTIISTDPQTTSLKVDQILNNHTQELFPEYSTLDVEKFAYEMYDNEKFIGGLIYTKQFDTIHITGLGFINEYRHQGLATQLMSLLEEDVSKIGIHTISLSTLSYQALPFYQKLGYQIYGEISDFPRRGVTKYNLYKRTHVY